MASKIVFVLTLIVLLRVSVSLPVSMDLKTVQSTDSVLERTTVLSSEKKLRFQEDNKLVQSFNMETLLKAFEKVEADSGKRIKRGIINTSVLCPNDRYECGGQCLTKEQYEDCDDGSESSDEYNAER